MHISDSFTIKTRSLQLRIPSEEDFPHIMSATKHPGFNDGMLWEPPSSIEELEGPLNRGLAAWKTGEAYQFSIEDAKNGDFLGRIGIRRIDQNDHWDVGFWTHPSHQGKGVMTEALNAVVAFGFEDLGAEQITACYATWNIASEKVLHKCGFTFTRFIPQGFQKKGEWVAENEVTVTNSDWVAR